jgi:hypothetical protein
MTVDGKRFSNPWDNPNAGIHLYNTGRFALETHANGIRNFLKRYAS